MYPYQNPALSPEERTEDLLSRMTLREKIGQLNQRLFGFGCYTVQGEDIAFTREFQEEVERYSGLGCLYGLHRADPWSKKDFETGLAGVLSPRAANRVQKYVLDHSRLGIPALMSTECPHGPQILDGFLLPVNLASAAAFDPDLLREAAEVSAMQLRALGVHLALVSALDVLRDPRWGRSEECFGEDPYLASCYAQAVVEGIRSQGVAVTAKHLCAQGETTGGVNASAARIGPRELREIHLPPVKACVDAGAESFMAAYNEIDGVYCHANRELLTGVLREEYGFRGFVMSDGGAIDQLVPGDDAASGAAALNAGVDLGLWDMGFRALEDAIRQGLTDQETVTEAARRVLLLKFRLGLFENPFVPETRDWEAFRDDPRGERLAAQTPVLLKNSGLLPLDREKCQKILLTGPCADELYRQLGDYTPPVRTGVTLRQGLEALLAGSRTELTYIPGGEMFGAFGSASEEMLRTAEGCDLVIYAGGGSSSRFVQGGEFADNGAILRQERITMDCGENVDNASLILPGCQEEELSALHALGKKVVTVVIAGRPYAMEAVDANSDALIYSFYPGPWGGKILAELLFGKIPFAGRLPVSLPRDAGRLPVYYNPKSSYAPCRYYDEKSGAMYSFGSGGSGTRFDFRLLSAPEKGRLALRFRVENTGDRPGYAVPQLYLHRVRGIVTSRVMELRGFRKVFLEPGHSAEMEIAIAEEGLTQYDGAMRPVTPPGTIQWFLRDEGKTLLEGEFTV